MDRAELIAAGIKQIERKDEDMVIALEKLTKAR